MQNALEVSGDLIVRIGTAEGDCYTQELDYVTASMLRVAYSAHSVELLPARAWRGTIAGELAAGRLLASDIRLTVRACRCAKCQAEGKHHDEVLRIAVARPPGGAVTAAVALAAADTASGVEVEAEPILPFAPVVGGWPLLDAAPAPAPLDLAAAEDAEENTPPPAAGNRQGTGPTWWGRLLAAIGRWLRDEPQLRVVSPEASAVATRAGRRP